MRTHRAVRVVLLLLCMGTLRPMVASAAAAARWSSAPVSEDADADSTIDGFLRGMADSTDRYFGMSAARGDTAGYDSALAYGIQNPRQEHRRNFAINGWPDFDFNRVDGPVYGAQVRIGQPHLLGQLAGKLGYAVGPNEWHGYGGIRKNHRIGNATWVFDVSAGRLTAIMNRERHGLNLPGVRALFNGKDNRHYLRHDGLDTGLERQADHWRVGVRFRDMLEAPLVTNTTWNLVNAEPSVNFNLPATRGRVNEFMFHAGWLLPMIPVTAEVTHWNSSDAIGSDFDYRRTRFAMSGNFGLGQVASLVPQAAYGRLSGTFVPQEAFYLGGSHTLRSVRSESLGGTGMALARLDLIGANDILAWAHIPHPAAFPIQAGLFGATGSVWGRDPYGGPTVVGDYRPERESWRSEAGASLYYQPGFPSPTSVLRLDYARGLGPESQSRFGLSFTHAIDLVRPFED